MVFITARVWRQNMERDIPPNAITNHTNASTDQPVTCVLVTGETDAACAGKTRRGLVQVAIGNKLRDIKEEQKAVVCEDL